MTGGLSTTSPLRGQLTFFCIAMSERHQAAAVPELTVSEAAAILGVNRRTVLRLIQQGLLRYRSAALPTSIRPRYRIPRIDIMELRTDYRVREPALHLGRLQSEPTPEDDVKLLGFE